MWKARFEMWMQNASINVEFKYVCNCVECKYGCKNSTKAMKKQCESCKKNNAKTGKKRCGQCENNAYKNECGNVTETIWKRKNITKQMREKYGSDTEIVQKHETLLYKAVQKNYRNVLAAVQKMCGRGMESWENNTEKI